MSKDDDFEATRNSRFTHLQGFLIAQASYEARQDPELVSMNIMFGFHRAIAATLASLNEAVGDRLLEILNSHMDATIAGWKWRRAEADSKLPVGLLRKYHKMLIDEVRSLREYDKETTLTSPDQTCTPPKS